jgi:hypothetical protein
VYRWMLHHKVAVRNECSQVAKWYGSSIDIDDRKQAETTGLAIFVSCRT